MKDKGFRCVVIGVPGSRRRIGRLDCHGLIASSFPDVLKAPLAGIKLDLLGSGPLLCVQDSDCLIGSVLAFKDSIFHFQIARKKRGASFVLPCDVSHRKTKAEAVCLRAHAGFRRAAVQDSSGSLLIETFKATVPRFKRDRRSQDPELPIPRENVGDIHRATVIAIVRDGDQVSLFWPPAVPFSCILENGFQAVTLLPCVVSNRQRINYHVICDIGALVEKVHDYSPRFRL